MSPIFGISLLLACYARPSLSASTIQIQLPSSIPSHNVVQDNFPGISLEFNVLNYLIGPSPGSIPTPMKNYLTNLRSRMSSDFRLRIGGNSLDGSFYDPSATQMINFNLASIAGGIKNVPVTYGPQILPTLSQLSSSVGGISHLIGLSLMYPYNDSDVVKFAQAAQGTLGSSLDSLLVGNEPDLYWENHKRSAMYSVANYSTEFSKVVSDLYKGGINASLADPSICCRWALSFILVARLIGRPSSLLRIALLESCTPAQSNSWNISYLTNHSAVQELLDWESDGILLAKQAGKTVIMNEFNSASCGGEPGRSDTFAAAMWTVDYALAMASRNFSAAYLHTREPGVTYNIFTYPNTTSVSNSKWKTGPPYYSLLLLTEALSTINSSASGSLVADLNLPNPLNTWGYAIYDSSASNGTGTPRAFVLSNAARGRQTFAIPSGLAPSLTLRTVVRTLSAPSLTEKTNVKYAGQSADGTGILQGRHSETALNCTMGCNVQVSGPGVALVVLQTQYSDAVPRLSEMPVALALLSMSWVIVSWNWSWS
ncbi:hypothetical protein DL93DRAFT_2051019 [Clavulina sp. PMI_390]|nr:hypothetical protein DL93DRAFT_2051019 [Clavulina sp. PMI_390]